VQFGQGKSATINLNNDNKLKVLKMTRTKIIIVIIAAFVLTFFVFDNIKLTKSSFLAQLLVSDIWGNASSDSIAADGSLIAVANLHNARAAHTATLLKDGTVLVCGGFAGSSSNSLSSAEIYNPSSKSFTQISDLTTPRVGHSATLLPNGKVLIAGGYNGNYLSTTEIYDPELKTFSPGPNMNSARHGHTATLLNKEKIIFIGGVGTGWTFLSSAEIYDIQSNKFIPSNSMTVARESHTATLLKNGNVLITGGHQGRRENVTIYSDSEIYDIKSNQFIATGNMNIPRRKHDAVLLADGKVLIHGGSDGRDSIFNSAEIYDPNTSLFTSISSMNYSRYKHKEMSILMPDNNVLIVGGSDKAEIYNAKTKKFTPLQGNLGAVRLFSCATLFDNGEVLITGGYDQNITAISEARLFVNKKR
jgi:hypothetical protein